MFDPSENLSKPVTDPANGSQEMKTEHRFLVVVGVKQRRGRGVVALDFLVTILWSANLLIKSAIPHEALIWRHQVVAYTPVNPARITAAPLNLPVMAADQLPATSRTKTEVVIAISQPV